MLTGGGDGMARLWDAATGKPVTALKADNEAVAAAFSADGRLLFTYGSNSSRRWPRFTSVQALVDEVKATVPSCLTAAQRETFHLALAAPGWCYTKNLWPYDAENNLGPRPLPWDERLVAGYNVVAGWISSLMAGKMENGTSDASR